LSGSEGEAAHKVTWSDYMEAALSKAAPDCCFKYVSLPFFCSFLFCVQYIFIPYFLNFYSVFTSIINLVVNFFTLGLFGLGL